MMRSSELFGLVVRFKLVSGQERAFDTLAAKMLKRVHTNEPGTLMYACHGVEGEPQARIFYELYANKAAFATHEKQSHVKRFLAERGQYLSEPPRVEFFSSTEGKNIPAGVPKEVSA